MNNADGGLYAAEGPGGRRAMAKVEDVLRLIKEKKMLLKKKEEEDDRTTDNAILVKAIGGAIGGVVISIGMSIAICMAAARRGRGRRGDIEALPLDNDF